MKSKILTISSLLSLLLTTSIHAQEVTAPAPDDIQPLPIILALMVVILGIVIIALAMLLRTGLQFKYGSGAKTRSFLGLALLFLLLGAGGNTHAAEAAAETAAATATVAGMHPLLFYTFVVVIAIEMIIIAVLYYGTMKVLRPETEKSESESKLTLMDRLNAMKPIEAEKDLLLDHDYDGIHELDNDLPPWWKYGFYVTILFACIYLWRFHVSGSAPLQAEEYQEQMLTAEAEVAAYKEKVGNLVDENNVTVLTEASAIGKGKEAFIANCAACHGQLGEGGVGPNLTDTYWLHGGSIQDVFKTIKYGWPQKGMKSWEKDLGAKQIQEVSSFILSLKGTNPPNAKEPQGEAYSDTPADSNTTAQAVSTDSVAVKIQ